MLITALVLIVILLVLASVLSVSDNMIQIEAQNQGIDTSTNNLGIFPSLSEMISSPVPDYADKSKYHRLSKGYDIKIAGKANEEISSASVSRYAVKPGNYRGIAPIPKMEVVEGDEVKAGEALFFDKSNPSIKYVAPVSGEVVEVRRGAKRSISHVVILADKEQKFKQFEVPSADAGRTEVVEFLKSSGAWTLINQRPFDIIADPELIPANVFISCF